MFDALSQDYPGPLAPVEIAQQDDTQAPTGNTTIPAGWKLVPIEPTHAMVIEGLNAGLEHKDEPYFIYAAMLNAAPAPPAPASSAEPVGEVVVTWTQDRSRIVAVTRQDEEGRILSVIAEAPVAAQAPDHASEKLIAAARLAGWTFTVDADGRYTMREALPAMAQSAQAPAAAGDALEDYKVNGAQAARWAPSSAHWSGELCRLFGPDAREGINVLEARLRDAERDAFRYRTLRRKVSIAGGKFHILNLDPRYIAPDAAVELDATIDAAIAAQRKGNA
ncbi:hypothetical protein LWS69_07825 [Bordetella hinzii]|nr:hypothetical protein [Bordetella hinzii]